MSVSEILVLLQRDFISGTNLVSLSLKSPRLVISSQFLFFNDKSFTALKSYSATYEDGNVTAIFLPSWLMHFQEFFLEMHQNIGYIH